MRVTDSRTPAEIFRDDSALLALEGQMSADLIDRDALTDLEALGLIFRLDHGHAAMLSDEGRRYAALLRVVGDAPRGVVTATATATGATMHYWPQGFGGPRILAARHRDSTRLLDYAEPFNPVGTSGRSEADTLPEAARQVRARALELESQAAATCAAVPWAARLR